LAVLFAITITYFFQLHLWYAILGFVAFFLSLLQLFKPPAPSASLLGVLDGTVKSKDQLSSAIWKRSEAPKAETVAVLPPVHCVDVRRFSIKNESVDAVKYLDDHGYVVFKDVLTEEEILKARELLWKWILTNGAGNIHRDDPQTWGNNNWPGNRQNGIISEDGIGQSEFLWYLRGIPNVKKAFASIWKSDKLLVSFDGCGLFRPTEYDSSWKTLGGWYHVDQNYNGKKGRHAVQGLVTLYDGDESTGGLVVIPDSPFLHKEVAERRGSKGTFDLVFIPIHDPALRKPGQLVKCKSGDLILWDSRTIHCNSPALVDVKENNKKEKKKLGSSTSCGLHLYDSCIKSE